MAYLKKLKTLSVEITFNTIMKETLFKIPQMDCPSEEQLIRTKLSGISTIKNLDFDIPNRKLIVYHNGQTDEIEHAILDLKLGGKKISSQQTNITTFNKNVNQKKLLWTVLAINFMFFIVEMVTGFLSKSMGLVADSLDMLADAFVYGISLLAVGGSLVRKKSIAMTAGVFQIALAILGFSEILRRFFGTEKYPDFKIMVVVSIFALIANSLCLYLLQKAKSKEVHMQASMIFTSNDVIINLGVITAALLVHWLNSSKPDLIIGIIVFVLVLQGGIRILKLAK